MRQARWLRRAGGMLAVFAVVGVGACKDSGLPDRNLPIDEARNREFRFTAYQPTADNATIAFAGRHWMRTLPVETIAPNVLMPVGSADGVQFHAVRGSRAPYSRLYAPVGEGRWAPYVRLN